MFHYLQFQVAHGRVPRDTASFNDALYYVKTSGLLDSELRRFVSDKEFLKVFVGGVVGNQHNVPTHAVLKSAEVIRNFRFEPGMVVKPTHASGEMLVVREGGAVDIARILSWLHLDYYQKTRERNYRRLVQKVMVEPLVFGAPDPVDFKFHCSGGRVRLIHVDFDRSTAHTRAFFTPDFERLPFSIGYPISENPITAPRNLTHMIAVAEELAAHFSCIRVDMYTDGELIRVGELTSVHGNAHEHFYPKEAELEYGCRFFDRREQSGSLRRILTR